MVVPLRQHPRWYAALTLAPDRDFAVFAATNASGLENEGFRGTDQAAQVLIRRLDAAAPVRHRIEPDPPVAGQDATITYLSRLGPLAGSKEMTIHYGADQWRNVQDISMTQAAEGGWVVTVGISAEARQIDFCFTNGDRWDNNSGKDWHVLTCR